MPYIQFKSKNTLLIPILYQFDNLLPYSNCVKHAITTNKGGFSSEPFGEWNMSLKVGESAEIIRQNRALLAEFFEVESTSLHFANLDHTNNVGIIKSIEDLEDIKHNVYDALVTNLASIVLAVTSADCVPILFYDTVKNVIAAVHAGWKGTVNNIAEKTLSTMIDSFDCKKENIIVCIGPSISKSKFEVGDEVAEKFSNQFDKLCNVVSNNGSKWNIDLWLANKLFLERAGLQSQQIFTSYICTFTDPNYYSYRKNNTTGRFVAAISLK